MKNTSEPMAGVHTEVSADLYRRARLLAIESGMFIKAWIARAVVEKVEREEKKAAK